MNTKPWYKTHRATRISVECKPSGDIYLSLTFNGTTPWEYVGTQGQRDAKSFAKYLREIADRIESPATTGADHG